MAEFDFDLAIVGGGPGGYVAAIRAAQLGLKTVVIEKNKLGGVCGNIGCIPSKALLHQAELFNGIKHLEELGLRVDKSGFDYRKVWEKSRAASERSGKGVAALLKKNKVEVLPGTARLVDAHTVQVSAEGTNRTVKAKSIVLATGSRPREIPGFEFDEKMVLSSTGVLMMEKLPASMLILGAGAIGMELAFVLSSFGVKITVIEMQDRVLPIEDADVSKIIEQDFKRRGIETRCSTSATNLVRSPAGVSLTVTKDGKSESLEAQTLLVAVGRVPNTADLGLEALGVSLEKGFVKTGDYYQTSVPGVYAIGDIVSTPLLAHVASKEGEIAVEHIAGHPGRDKRVDPLLVPSAVYTEPGVGSFGLTEAEALKRGIEAGQYTFPYAGIGKAGALGKTNGLVKIVYEKKTKEILGAHIAGYSATEIIHEILLAKKVEALPEDIANLIHAHPTISEGVMEGARGIEGWPIHI